MNSKAGSRPGSGKANGHGKERRAESVATKKMSRSEAGRRGGQSTMKKYGSEFYQEIGRKGGKKGGNTTKERYGIEFYQKIGRKGGLK